MLDHKHHPEQAYRSCICVLSFASKASNERLASACMRALGYSIYNYKMIHQILENKTNSYEDSFFADELPMASHDNIHGENYYK